MRKKDIISDIKILHQTQEEKKQFNTEFDQALLKAGYKYRRDWLKEKIKELINSTK